MAEAVLRIKRPCLQEYCDMTLKILRPKAGQAKLGIGHTKYYELNRSDPTFPKDVILGKRARGKFEHELDAWLESKREAAGAGK